MSMVETTLEIAEDSAPPASPDAVEIRGRGGLHAVVALGAGAIAVAYAWRIGDGAATAWWALVALLAVVTAVNLTSWLQSRTPQLVADEQGVRVRQGRSWTGLPWERIESTRVERPGGRVGDSVLVLTPADGADEVRVSYGAARGVSTPDLQASLDELRSEHARIAFAATVVTEAPASRSEVSDQPAPRSTVREPHVLRQEASEEPREQPVHRHEANEEPRGEAMLEPAASAVVERPSREPVAPVRRTLSAVATARRAVRAQVHREGPATVGSSALKHQTAVLPEISELRRTEGKVGLVIETVPAPLAQPVDVPVDVPATAVGAAPVEAYPTQPAPEPLIGPQLSAARTYLRVSVDELAERTRIRPHVIESIEVDDFVPCGGDFYARGHLRALCRTLGVDPAPLLEMYDREYAQAPVAARRIFEAELAASPQAAIRSTGGGPRWSVLLGVVMVLAIVWGAAKIVTERTADPSPDPVVTSLSNLPDQQSLEPNGLAALGAPPTHEIRVVATARARVAVRDAEGALVWRGRLRAGDGRSVEVTGSATVRASRADAVRLFVNGEPRGRVGQGDAAARRVVGGTSR
jgi:hypothetical protein